MNHLCKDALHPRSHTDLDGTNTVAHEQCNAPFNLMSRSLRACGQDQYVAILPLENMICNIMAHAPSTSPHRLHENYNFRQHFFSRCVCSCGYGYSPSAPPVPPAARQPDAVAVADPLGVGERVVGDDW